MTFTTTPPTTPGFYAWRQKDGQLGSIHFDKRPSHIHLKCFENMSLEWCRLVPAEEVVEAYFEAAVKSELEQDKIDFNWNRSRAKQVAEGTI